MAHWYSRPQSTVGEGGYKLDRKIKTEKVFLTVIILTKFLSFDTELLHTLLSVELVLYWQVKLFKFTVKSGPLVI